MLISRLPIFDRQENVVGYESTIQWKQDPFAAQQDPLATIGENFEDFVGNGWLLVALPVDKISAGGHELLPMNRTVVEPVLCGNDQAFLECLSRLRKKAYSIALSSPHGCGPSAIAGMVCLDGKDPQNNIYANNIRRAHADECLVMSRSIDTEEAFALSKEAGSDFFQGRFFCQRSSTPSVLPPDQDAAVKRLAALQSPNVLLHDIEELDFFDGELSSRLLDLANKAEGRRVESLRYAVGTVGMEVVRQWASVLLLSTVERKPLELCITAAIRGKMCELLADSDSEQRRAMFFSAGICSVLDAVLDRPIHEVATDLPVSAELRDALVAGTGVLGSTIDAILSYESADWESVSLRPFPPNMIQKAYLDALHWTRTVCHGLGIQQVGPATRLAFPA